MLRPHSGRSPGHAQSSAFSAPPMKTTRCSRAMRLTSAVVAVVVTTTAGQTILPETDRDETSLEEDEPVVRLSPFSVTTDRDRGYKATNTTAGTRLDTPIRDVPLAIEVIT